MAAFMPVLMVHPNIPGVEEWADTRAELVQMEWDGWTRKANQPVTPPQTTPQRLTALEEKVVPASTTTKGLVELATNAETTTGTDAVRAVTPAGLKAVRDALPSDPALRAALLPFWAPGEAVAAGAVRVTSLGITIRRNAPGTTRPTFDAIEAALWTVVAAASQPGGPLAAWKAKLALDPANAKVGFVVDSTSDPAIGAWSLFARLYGLHTQHGEALFGLGRSDYFTDGVSTGTTTFASATAAFVAGDKGRFMHGKKFQAGTIIASVDSSTQVTLTKTVPSGTALPFWIGRHIVAAGNNGVPLADYMSQPSRPDMPFNRDRYVAEAPDLSVVSCLRNDMRTGAFGTTVEAIVPIGIARLTEYIDWHRVALPNTPILLRMPNTTLSANVGGLNYVTDGQGNINPPGLAQIYTDALRRIYLSFIGKYPNVDVLDLQAEVFGVNSTPSHPYMADQLHPSPHTTSDINFLTPIGGGYVAVADAIAKRIGFARNAFAPAEANRFRHEFFVYDGPAAGSIQLTGFDVNFPASQALALQSDSLQVNGIDAPFALTSANIDRAVGANILQLTGLGSTDFSPFIGKTAVITGSHPDGTTKDRKRVFIDLPSIAAGATVAINANVAGVEVGSPGWAVGVLADPGGSFGSSGLFLLGCYPDSTGRVKLIIQNPTGAAIDIAGEVWTFWVVR